MEETNKEELPKPEPAKPKFVTVMGTSLLNLRKTPGTNSEVLCTLRDGTMLEVNAVNNNWLQVTTEVGVTGYCMAKFTTYGTGK